MVKLRRKELTYKMEEIIASGWDCGGGEQLEDLTCWSR